jgi:hypothetical protein
MMSRKMPRTVAEMSAVIEFAKSAAMAKAMGVAIENMNAHEGSSDRIKAIFESPQFFRDQFSAMGFNRRQAAVLGNKLRGLE